MEFLWAHDYQPSLEDNEARVALALAIKERFLSQSSRDREVLTWLVNLLTPFMSHGINGSSRTWRQSSHILQERIQSITSCICLSTCRFDLISMEVLLTSIINFSAAFGIRVRLRHQYESLASPESELGSALLFSAYVPQARSFIGKPNMAE